MGSLTRRPYLLAGFFHMIIGFLLFGCGVTWLVMTFVYWPKYKVETNGDHGWDATEFYENNAWTKMPMKHQVWAWMVYTAQIWTGFWIMLAGCFAMCVKENGCLEKLFLFMNVMTMVLFAPAAIILSLDIFFNVTIAGDSASLESYSFIYKSYMPSMNLFSELKLNNDDYPWILAFPVAGLSLAFIEFVLSVVSCSVCLCCRPTRSSSY